MVPRQWENETVVLIASGPSLTQQDVDSCQGRARVLVINDNYRLAPWADALYACDLRWWEEHHGVESFPGQKWTQSPAAAEKWRLRLIKGDHKNGLSFDPDLIHYGGNSGYQAINLAVHFGVRRILLLGYDMQCTGGKLHWFGNHPDGLTNNLDYQQFIKHYDSLPPDLARAGVEVINCSRQTALTCFPRQGLHDALSGT